MKKVIAALLAACMALALCACGRSAFGRREKSGNMEFTLDRDSDTYTLVFYTDTSRGKELVIPDEFNGKRVTAIGRLAVSSADTLERIVLGPNIESIDKWGIVGCRYLKSIEVDGRNERFRSAGGVLYSKDGTVLVSYPNAHSAVYSDSGALLSKAEYSVEPGTKIIGHCAFYRCYGLEKVILPEGVETIEDRAFHKCEALREINFPAGLRAIGMDAFLGCEALTELALPASIREIGDYAFYNAMNIERITIAAAEKDVTLGERWFPTSAGRDIRAEIIWKED